MEKSSGLKRIVIQMFFFLRERVTLMLLYDFLKHVDILTVEMIVFKDFL